MKLTPLDIRKQEFKRVLRGYDRVEIDTFMEMVANEFEELLRSQKDMRDRAVELEVQLKDDRQIEKTLQQTLLQAQETTGENVRNGPEGSGIDCARPNTRRPESSPRHNLTLHASTGAA